MRSAASSRRARCASRRPGAARRTAGDPDRQGAKCRGVVSSWCSRTRAPIAASLVCWSSCTRVEAKYAGVAGLLLRTAPKASRLVPLQCAAPWPVGPDPGGGPSGTRQRSSTAVSVTRCAPPMRSSGSTPDQDSVHALRSLSSIWTAPLSPWRSRPLPAVRYGSRSSSGTGPAPGITAGRDSAGSQRGSGELVVPSACACTTTGFSGWWRNVNSLPVDVMSSRPAGVRSGPQGRQRQQSAERGEPGRESQPRADRRRCGERTQVVEVRLQLGRGGGGGQAAQAALRPGAHQRVEQHRADGGPVRAFGGFEQRPVLAQPVEPVRRADGRGGRPGGVEQRPQQDEAAGVLVAYEQVEVVGVAFGAAEGRGGRGPGVAGIIGGLLRLRRPAGRPHGGPAGRGRRSRRRGW